MVRDEARAELPPWSRLLGPRAGVPPEAGTGVARLDRAAEWEVGRLGDGIAGPPGRTARVRSHGRRGLVSAAGAAGPRPGSGTVGTVAEIGRPHYRDCQPVATFHVVSNLSANTGTCRQRSALAGRMRRDVAGNKPFPVHSQTLIYRSSLYKQSWMAGRTCVEA